MAVARWAERAGWSAGPRGGGNRRRGITLRRAPDRSTTRWWFGLLALLIGALVAVPAQGRDALPAQIDRLLPELPLDSAQVSVYVRQVDRAEPTLAFNAEVARAPASVIKLVTSIAALDLLGPEHRWATEVYRVGSVADGTLRGDLILRGYGDPHLSNDAFVGLLRALRAKGIETIAGDLIIDEGQLAPPVVGRYDFDGAGQSAYNALHAGLSLNRQVTHLVIYHDRPNGRVGVYTDPPLSGVDLVNDATLVSAPCQARHHRLNVQFSQPEGERARLRVSGSFASECPDERVARLVLRPEQHAASAFDALWRELGGRIEGRIRLGQVPPGAVLVHRLESPPLGEVLRDINKLSNNLAARLVFLGLAAGSGPAPVTLEQARDQLMAWLGERGFVFPELFVDNGSGLSRVTRIAAASLGELLVWSYHQPWMPELLGSMAIAGVDGTMRRRLRFEPIQGRAHLKTGTLCDASGIAGYVLDAHGRRWVVVVLVNALPGATLAAWHGHAVQHAVLRWVHDGAGLPAPAPDDRALLQE